MKKYLYFLFCLLCGCMSFSNGEKALRERVKTEREKPYYLTTDPQQVEDTCPENNILQTFNCTKAQPDGFTCFDVYLVQGSPVNEQKYTLLQQTVEEKNVTPQPPCPNNMQADCSSFLKALNYNLEFSWYLVNFPSSSFQQCQETYDCKRIDCYLSSEKAENLSTLVSCVYKRNQVFFVGSEVTCRQISS